VLGFKPATAANMRGRETMLRRRRCFGIERNILKLSEILTVNFGLLGPDRITRAALLRRGA
jgi:hypothetical protein